MSNRRIRSKFILDKNMDLFEYAANKQDVSVDSSLESQTMDVDHHKLEREKQREKQRQERRQAEHTKRMQDINKALRENKARAHKKAVSIRQDKLKRESEKNRQSQNMKNKKKELDNARNEIREKQKLEQDRLKQEKEKRHAEYKARYEHERIRRLEDKKRIEQLRKKTELFVQLEQERKRQKEEEEKQRQEKEERRKQEQEMHRAERKKMRRNRRYGNLDQQAKIVKNDKIICQQNRTLSQMIEKNATMDAAVEKINEECIIVANTAIANNYISNDKIAQMYDVAHVNIFQTLTSFNNIQKYTDLLKCINSWNIFPRSHHFKFDDEECLEYVPEEINGVFVLDAYRALIPGAYKSDLWRLCMLYEYGGAYMDIHIKCLLPHDLQQMFEKYDGIFVIDCEPFRKTGIYNAFMYFKHRKDPIALLLLEEIVDNVTNRRYFEHPLAITGPIAHAKVLMRLFNYTTRYSEEYHYKGRTYMLLHHQMHKKRSMSNTESIQHVDKNNKCTTLMQCRYPAYRDDMHIIKKTHVHYSQAWRDRQVYKKN
jgi:hypothetical protein